jgi:putative ABC transport system ATP-binding protein
MTAALHVHGVVVVRGEGRRAQRVLDGADLVVARGEIVLLEGPSGSGKTTLMLAAAGLLTPEEGTVEVAGVAWAGVREAERRRRRAGSVGFVFQRANLLDRLTVRENVEIAGALAGMSRADSAAQALGLLDELGVGELADRLPAHLSGGEEHRVAVARALVHRPALVLADEPTGNLDAQSGQAVAAALARLARQRGAAIVVATHDARLRPFADRRVRIEHSKVLPVEEGS